jgi:hypothetical protein
MSMSRLFVSIFLSSIAFSSAACSGDDGGGGAGGDDTGTPSGDSSPEDTNPKPEDTRKDDTKKPEEDAPGPAPAGSLGALTDAEADAYCKEQAEVSKKAISEADSKTAVCTLLGVLATAAPGVTDKKATCEKSFDECSAKPASAGGDPCANFATKVDGCAATKAEYEACQKETTDALKALAAKGKTICSELDKPLAISNVACKALTTKCPALKPKS